jgi:hypothetical protein
MRYLLDGLEITSWLRGLILKGIGTDSVRRGKHKSGAVAARGLDFLDSLSRIGG